MIVPRKSFLYAVIGLALARTSAAAPPVDEVKSAEVPLVLPWTSSVPNYLADPKNPKPLYPSKDSRKAPVDRTFNTIVLENKYLKVQAIPELGGVVARTIFKPASTDFFYFEQQAKDYLPWWESGVKLSFPYYEHGLSTDNQPASFRLVQGPGGEVKLAEFMEFSRHNQPYQRKRYGRYSSMFATQTISLLPDHAAFSVTYRLYNPTPYRQGRRLWVDTYLPRNDSPRGPLQGAAPAPVHSTAEWVFPAHWVSDHAGAGLREYADKCKLGDYLGGSYSVFAWDVGGGFAGLYYPETQTNRLRIFDPAVAPGAKQWFMGDPKPSAAGTLPAAVSGNQMFNYAELWGGTDHIFESIENWIGPGETFSFTYTYILARGIHKAAYADETMVLALTSDSGGDVLEILPTRTAAEIIITKAGKPVGRAVNVSPENPARISLGKALAEPGQLVVNIDGRKSAFDQFPTQALADTKKHDLIKTGLKNKYHAEMRGNADEFGTTFENAISQYPDGSTDRGRVLYRAGRLDDAIACLEKATAADAGDGEAWHLLGAALLESAKTPDARAAFTRAIEAKNPYSAARYYLASIALGAGDTATAIVQLDGLIKANPAHWEARLLRAAADPTAGRAAQLAGEDAADPRVHWVLAQRKADGAQAALESLLAEPGAPARLDEFIAATRGQLKHPQRLK